MAGHRLITVATSLALVGSAASAAEPGNAQFGGYAGASITLRLGGNRPARPEAELKVAPTMLTVSPTGPSRSRTGEGIALRLSGGKPPIATVAGLRADHALAFKPHGRPDAKDKFGLSAGVWVGLGVVAVVGVLAIVVLSRDCDQLIGEVESCD